MGVLEGERHDRKVTRAVCVPAGQRARDRYSYLTRRKRHDLALVEVLRLHERAGAVVTLNLDVA
jgi:hypothetical protein